MACACAIAECRRAAGDLRRREMARAVMSVRCGSPGDDREGCVFGLDGERVSGVG